MTKLLFTYGTLMTGMLHHDKLVRHPGQAKFVCKGTLYGTEMRIFPTSYSPIPVVVTGDKEEDCVVGEVWEISKALSRVLDYFEEGAGYVARDCPIVLETEEIVEAEVYFFVEEKLTKEWGRVESGDFRRFLEERANGNT